MCLLMPLILSIQKVKAGVEKRKKKMSAVRSKCENYQIHPKPILTIEKCVDKKCAHKKEYVISNVEEWMVLLSAHSILTLAQQTSFQRIFAIYVRQTTKTAEKNYKNNNTLEGELKSRSNALFLWCVEHFFQGCWKSKRKREAQSESPNWEKKKTRTHKTDLNKW